MKIRLPDDIFLKSSIEKANFKKTKIQLILKILFKLSGDGWSFYFFGVGDYRCPH